jgi:RHS repeat-associated protein
MGVDIVMASSRTMGRVLLFFSFILACQSPCLSYGVDEDSGGATAKVALGGVVSSGSDSVQPDLFTGAMSYQIPIEVPPGRNGMDPKLALSYSSRNANGWVGVGWDLEVGAIERSTRTGVDYTKDEYSLRRSGSTEELVAVSLLEYRSKIENDFTKINQIKVTDSYPSRYFVATNKAGIKFYYGQTENSCVYGPQGVFKWALSRIEDTNGNFITFTYFRDNGQIYLDHIDYNGNQINFYREDRDDKPAMFTSNFSIKTSKRLKTIDVLANGATIRKYELSYDTDPAKPGDQYSVKTGRSLLSTVTQYNKDGGSLPAIKLSYSSGNNFVTREWSTNPFKAAENLSDKNEAVISGDFDGDGKIDVAHARNEWDGWRVSRSTSTGFETGGWSTSPYPPVTLLSEILTYNKYFYTWACHYNANGVQICGYESNTQLVTEQRVNERVITGDFDGDGKTDVAHTRSGWPYWRVSLSTGKADTGFINGTSDWPVGQQFLAADRLYDHNEEIITGDFNGDGKTDVARARSEWTEWQVSLSTGSGFVTGPPWSTNGKAIDRLSDNNEQVIVGDFNGDGKTDVAHSRSEWDGWRVSLSTGSGFVTDLWPTDGWAIDKLSDNNEEIIVGDFNGDGKTDVAHSRSEWGGWRVSLSTGSGFVTEFWPTDSWAIDKLNDNNEQVIVGDFNGDGKTDIAHSRSEWNIWRVSLSTGSGFVTEDWPTNGWAIDRLSDGNERIITGDFNGDGLTDIAHTKSELGGWKVSGNTVLTSPVPDMLVTIDNGSGGVWNINYTPSTMFDSNKLPFPVQVVSSISNNDGNSNISTTTFDYSNGYFHIGEKDFRGFNHVTVRGQVGPSGEQKVTETWFHQGNETGIVPENATSEELRIWANVFTGYMKGKPYRVRISDGNGKIYSETETTYALDKDNAAPWFNPHSKIDTYTCDGSVTVQCKGTGKYYWTEYEYDSEPGATEYGNLTYEKRHGDDADPNDDLTIYRTYSPNPSAWIIGLPISEAVFNGIGTAGTKMSETIYYYDGGVTNCSTESTNQYPDKGRLTRIKRWLYFEGETETYVNERMAYDGYGNLICRRDARGFITTTGYDPSNTFPVSVTSPPTALFPSGLATTITYYGVGGVLANSGLYGQVKSITDPNGAVTTKEYDPFGRPSKETHADGTWTSWAYNNFGTVGSQHVRVSTSDDLQIPNSFLWTDNYFDGFGRTYLSNAKGPESQVIATHTVYDARGAVQKSSLPYFDLETSRYVQSEYDPIGRISKTEQESTADKPIRTLTCYDKDVTKKIDPNSHQRREVRDATGRLTSVLEYTGTTGSCGSEGNTLLYATTSYKYDVLGNLLSVTDTKTNKTEMKYDSLGRKRYMSDPDMGVWRYTYDANGNLETQTDAKGQIISFTYDELNRLKTKSHGTTVVLTNTYDEVATGCFNKGRLTKMVYPSSQPTAPPNQTVYNYDKMGNVASTTKTIDGTAYTLGFTYPNGRLGSITYPDNVAVNYTYDVGYLKGVAGYVAYSNFDAMGRPWNAAYGTAGVSSRYEYDSVTKRLSSLTVTSSKYTLPLIDNDYDYDNKGNVTSITDNLNKVLPTSYLSDSFTLYPGRAHVVGTTGNGRNFHPDSNGNIDYDGLRTIIYNYENMPTSVDSVNFTYDGNATRIKKSSPGVTTVYIDKFYECTKLTQYTDFACTKFIFAGNTRIALNVGNETRFYHPDHQGSTSAVTDKYGYSTDDISYFPFGERRQAGSASVTHLYTGQELDGTGFYNYNARLYDPNLGRFMTPDSIVPDYTNPQSFNRYGYALNNPMRFADPTGHYPEDTSSDFDFDIDFELGGGSSMATSTVSNVNSAFNSSFGQTQNSLYDSKGTYSENDSLWRQPQFSSATPMQLASVLTPGDSDEVRPGAKGGGFGESSAGGNFVPRGGGSGAAAEVAESVVTREATGFLGSRNFQMQNAPYQPLMNSRTVINNIEYSGHALDQMQNRGLTPTIVENALSVGNVSPGRYPGTMRVLDPFNNVTIIQDSITRRIITVIPGGK